MEVLYLLSYGSMAPQAGLEPATDRLTADSSTTELLRNNITAWRRPTLTGGSPQLPSALKSLTSVFGMGTGVTSSLLPPDKLFYRDKYYYNQFLKDFKDFFKNFVLSKLDKVHEDTLNIVC